MILVLHLRVYVGVHQDQSQLSQRIAVCDKHWKKERGKQSFFLFVRFCQKDLAVTLTSTKATTTSTNAPVTLPICSNGGNLVDGICHCPSGFGGIYCQQKFGKLNLVYLSAIDGKSFLYAIRYSSM